MANFRTIQHSITATNQFGGVAPGGALSTVNGIETYAAAATGGLFDFAQRGPTPVKYFAFKGGGQSSWSLKLFDAAGNDLGVIASGTNEASKYVELGLVLMKGDKLKLVTAGATTAMVARITTATR